MRAPRLELPADPTIDRLPDTIRLAIGKHWMHRASAELGVACAFDAFVPRLRDVGAADVVVALGVKAIEDERRHGELCVRLAERYLGEAMDAPPPRYESLQSFGTGDEPTEVALIALGMCCINESIASEWIRSCWQVARARAAVAANKHHLKDEIDHARLGWAHLASSALGPALRRRLRPWIAESIAVNVAEWKRPDPFLPEEGVPAHGHLSREENHAVIDAAVRDVVVPGLAHVGL